ncbi:MAG: hypothetical protein IJR77_05300 [Bacteroidales bacterium]|nr:hypothetical protein [Bacteroidales bacterium]
MEENFDALEVLARTRGKVEMDQVPIGENIFLVWGWPTAVFFLLEFVLWLVFHQQWCLWLWVGIPIVAVPLMVRLLKKDHERTHTRTHDAKVILDYWIFVGFACFVSGLVFGFSGQYDACFMPLVCLLVGIGSFITGEILRFKPKTICGLAGCVIGIGAFLFTGELWHWQLLAVALVAIIALIVPGILYNKRVRDGI